MKDRSVQYPKRYRLTKIPGTDDIYDLDPAPGEITEEGTLINKGTLLSDDTAAKFFESLVGTETVNQVLKTIGDTQTLNKVGDIKTTARNDLGDKWLLCNGDEASSHDYSELATMFPSLMGNWSAASGYSSGTNDRIYCVAYGNGYWVAGGEYMVSSGNYTGRIMYTTDPAGSWTEKDIWRGSIHCITYAEGYWVVGGQYNGSQGAIAYTTSLSGSWTIKTITNGSNDYIYCITYADGYWVVGGIYYSMQNYTAKIAYATSPDGSWTEKDLWSSGNSAGIFGITYADGYWVVCGRNSYFESNTWYPMGEIAYATSPAGPWTRKTVFGNGGNISCITYAGGYWVVGGDISGNGAIAYTTSLSGAWTEKDLSGTFSYIYCITYAEGYWVVGGQYRNSSSEYRGRIIYATFPSGPWAEKDLWSGNFGGGVQTITYANGYWMAGGSYTNYANASSTTKCSLYYRSADYFTLPTISFHGVYGYIKAKEG